MPSPRRRARTPAQNHQNHWIASHKHTIGVWLLMIGFLLVTFPTAFKALQNLLQGPAKPQSLEQAKPDLGPIQIDQKLLGAVVTAQPPVRIVIPSLSVDLPIVEANVLNGYWEISETSASHGVGSANPGEVGNTVIFAHAREGLFAPLRDIKKNSPIYILTKEHWHRYRVVETKLVDPNQTEVIAPTADETLTLYTCSGFLDSKRLIVTAKPLLL